VSVIRYTQGDVLGAEAEALVNTVNCVGVMGRGVALQFKRAYPENFAAYVAACERDEVEPGRMFVFDTGQLAPRWIINFPTKKHWRGKSRIEYIERGMEALVEEIRARHIRSIAIPPLGSGLGGLAWSEVRPVIEHGLEAIPEVSAIVFEPGGGPPANWKGPKAAKRPRMTAGRAALVGLMGRYLSAMMDTSVTLLEVHKLMYFLQAAGEPLRLRYVKAPYGPYADNLRHVLREVNGYLITGYTGQGDAPNEELEVAPGAVESAESFLAEHERTREHFDEVAHLVEGFETPFGLELLASVHWVIAKEDAANEEEVTDAIYRWSPRKKQFSREQIEIAVQRLRGAGWAAAQPAR
jgi:O-acetyl-ADP-ribose deacetylase (regulator of RNase III)